MKNHAENLGWEVGVDFPVWANTEIYVKTISNGYLLPGEKPKDAYCRVSTARKNASNSDCGIFTILS